MAIEIIPRQKPEPEEGLSIPNVLYFFAVVLFLLTSLGYLGLGFLSKSSEKQLKNLSNEIVAQETPQIKMLEEKILNAKEKIEVFTDIFNSYKKGSIFFNFIKENCHKKVFFSKTALNVERGEFIVSGEAENFRTLGEQMIIFRNQNLVKNVNLSRVSLEKEGGVGFDLSLLLDPKAFK